jgi:hypothetical protein
LPCFPPMFLLQLFVSRGKPIWLVLKTGDWQVKDT